MTVGTDFTALANLKGNEKCRNIPMRLLSSRSSGFFRTCLPIPSSMASVAGRIPISGGGLDAAWVLVASLDDTASTGVPAGLRSSPMNGSLCEKADIRQVQGEGF